MKSRTKYYVDDSRIIDIFDNAKLGKVSKVLPLEAGEFNSAYSVTANDVDYVIKIAPNSSEHLLTYENDLMAREVGFYRLIQKHTAVKTPRIFFYDDSKKLIDSSYFIMEKLQSQPLSKCKLEKKEKETVYYSLGEAVALLHRIKGDKFGYEQNGLHDNWYLAIKAMVENLCADCKRYNKSDENGKRLVAYIEKYKDILMKVESTYTHFDIWDGNVFYQKQNGNVELTLIDTERGFWGDRIGDFVSIEMLCDFDKKKSIVSYNKTAEFPISFSREEIVRYNIMKAYLGLIVYTERFARYKVWQMKYLINNAMAKYFFKTTFAVLDTI